MNPVFASAEARTAEQAKGGADIWHDPRDDGADPRRLPRHGPDRRKPRRAARDHPPEQDEFGVRSQNLAEKALSDGFWQQDITPATLPDGTVGLGRRRAAARDHPGGGIRAEAGFPA